MNDMTSPPIAPRDTANPAPLRPANSIRRTSSIDVDWPEGPLNPRRFIGRARDYLTSQDGAGRTLAEAEYEARLDFSRSILAITAPNSPDLLSGLVGGRAGNHLRLQIAETLPELIETADPLYLVLDDMSGVALVSNWALTQWFPGAAEKMREFLPPEHFAKMMDRTNVCWGLQEGNSGLQGSLGANLHEPADAGELRNPSDPEGWHAFNETEKACFRRARRIDVTRNDDAGEILIDSCFQDSTTSPQGGRVAVHEYLLRAVADARTLEIKSITPEPRILPFWECPGAVANVQKLVGSTLPQIRSNVLDLLRGPAGCTHLNDALRALAEVPRLAEKLETGSS